MSEINLLETTDAKVWAQEFMRLHGDKLPDEGLMIAWFANMWAATMAMAERCGLDPKVVMNTNCQTTGHVYQTRALCMFCDEPKPDNEPEGDVSAAYEAAERD